MLNKAKFVRDGSQLVNIAGALTMTCNDKYLLLLNKQGKKILYKDGDGVLETFDKFKKEIKPDQAYGLVLDNGGFIDVRSVANVFVSPKTGNLVIVSHDERPLCVLSKSEYTDLDGLVSQVMDALEDVDGKKKISKIDWVAYQG